jgi:hypothetical protein
MPNAKLCQLSLLFIVAGCTTQPNKVANGGPDVQCHSEQTIGSLITKPICTTRAQRLADEAQLEELRDKVAAREGANLHPMAPVAQ